MQDITVSQPNLSDKDSCQCVYYNNHDLKADWSYKTFHFVEEIQLRILNIVYIIARMRRLSAFVEIGFNLKE